MILHEIIYRQARGDGHANSRLSRQFNDHLAAKIFDVDDFNDQRYRQLLSDLKLPAIYRLDGINDGRRRMIFLDLIDTVFYPNGSLRFGALNRRLYERDTALIQQLGLPLCSKFLAPQTPRPVHFEYGITLHDNGCLKHVYFNYDDPLTEDIWARGNITVPSRNSDPVNVSQVKFYSDGLLECAVLRHDETLYGTDGEFLSLNANTAVFFDANGHVTKFSSDLNDCDADN